MATQLYLANAAAPYTPATIRGAWDDSASAVTKALVNSPLDLGSYTTIAVAEANAANNYDVLLYRGVSLPLGAQTISGTMNVRIGIMESSGSANDYYHVHVYVTQGDTDTPRGTLLTDFVDTGNEWTTTTVKALSNSATMTLSNVTASSGDRIVVEIGYCAKNTSATSYTGTLGYGSNVGSGLKPMAFVADAQATTEGVPYVEFSGDLAFNATTEQMRLTHAPVEVLSVPPAKPIRLTQAPVEVLYTPVTTQTYSITGAGGVTFGGAGTVAYTQNKSVTGSGGVTFGGAATFSSNQNYSVVGAGGVTLGGAAALSVTATYSVAGTGGVVFGGAADLGATGTYTITGSGGVVLGGTAPAAGVNWNWAEFEDQETLEILLEAVLLLPSHAGRTWQAACEQRHFDVPVESRTVYVPSEPWRFEPLDDEEF